MSVFWTIFIPSCALLLVIYFWLFDRIFKGKKDRFLIHERVSKPTNREIFNTVLNLLIFGGMGFLVGMLMDHNILQVQSTMPQTSVEYVILFVTFIGALAVHDFYFYWTHRFLHVPFVFKHVHRWHHQSHAVNAWSAFSFHPLEGLIQIGVVPLVALIFSPHLGVLILFTFFLLFISVYGHCGYELRPNKAPAFRMFNTSLHHYQHHKFVRYNFGIYLNWWDKWFKTENPSYEQDFEKLSEKIKARN